MDAEVSTWLVRIGLLLDLSGAIIIAIPAFVSKERAINLGLTSYVPLGEVLEGTSPRVRALLLQSKSVKWGLLLLAFGFVLQLVGTWPI